MGVAYNSRVVTDGLVLCLDAANPKSYPGSGSIWKDLAGGDNNGTIQGPGFVSSNKGGFSFNGSTNYVTLPNNTLRTLQSLTVSSWVKFNQVNANNCLVTNPQNGLVGVTPWVSPYATWKLGVRRVSGLDYVELSIGTTSTFYEETVPTSEMIGGNISTSTVYNIVGTANPDTGVAGFRMYMNGNYTNPAGIAGGPWPPNCVVSQPILVGTDHGGNYVNGTIYNTTVYNRVLSIDEVRQNFNALRGRFGV